MMMLRIVNETGLGHDTCVTIAATGERLQGVRSVEIQRILPRGLVEAKLEVYAEIDLLCEGEVTLIEGYPNAIGAFRLP